MIRPVLPANLSFRLGLHHSKENAHIAKSRLLFIHEVMTIDDVMMTTNIVWEISRSLRVK
jgi:hypothetical protein